MTLDIKRIHNLPPHLSYVSTLPDITQKRKSYVVFLSVVRVQWRWKEPVSVYLKWLWAGCVAKSQYVFKVTSLCLYTYIAAMFATGFVDDALKNTVSSVNKPLF